MPLHNNLNGFGGDFYSLYDNLWVFTGSGTFTAPRTGWYLLSGCGGGGGGAGGISYLHAGGGAGASVYRVPVWMTEGESVSISIGALGDRGANTGSNGGNGGNTSFGSRIVLGGGKGGKYLTYAGGDAGVISGHYAHYNPAQAGENGSNHASASTGDGAGPGFAVLTFNVFGVPSILATPASGTPGVTPAPPANGVDGVGFGVGGSGAAANSGVGYYGGYGTPGILIVEMAP